MSFSSAIMPKSLDFTSTTLSPKNIYGYVNEIHYACSAPNLQNVSSYLFHVVSSDLTYGIVKEIMDLAELKENWDGDGALPIIKEVIENSVNAVRSLCRRWGAPEITPSPNGTVILEWFHNDVEFYLEIGKNNFCFLVGDKNGYRKDLAISATLTQASYVEILNNGSKLWNGYLQDNIPISTLSDI
ncbi:MAG: hypothetical protein FWH52_02180 [Synergistaceae bacterium]|nr:hypothetical protein [Synergistaceae bacterium]